MRDDNTKHFISGCKDGIPIALGYAAVGFSLGFAAKNAGLTAFQAFCSGILNHASAGEYAAFNLIASNGAYFEMALVILVTNCRYLLMSCALSQRIRPSESFWNRLLMGFCITDEVFGASIGQQGYIPPIYTYGVSLVAIPSWALGSMLGVILGNLLPARLVSVLSVALYGMFIACSVPEARKNKVVAAVIPVSYLASFMFSSAPGLSRISEGFRVIILTLIIAGAFAYFFPVKEAENEQ